MKIRGYGKSIAVENDVQLGYPSIIKPLFDPIIRAVGKHCRRFSSDILWDYEGIINDIAAGRVQDEYWFGIRKNGVDGKTYIQGRGDNFKYDAMFIVETSKNDNESGWSFEVRRAKPI